MFWVGVVDPEFPAASLGVLRFQTVRLNVGVADDVAVAVDPELLAPFIPVAPGVDRAVRLNGGVDEEVLHPPVAGAGEGVADPRHLDLSGRRLDGLDFGGDRDGGGGEKGGEDEWNHGREGRGVPGGG